MKLAAEFTADQLVKAGLQSVDVIETTAHPVVYGEWLGAPGKPTVLLYGHYDVQPARKEDWRNASGPFEPEEHAGQVYARGATDNKGQLLGNIKALQVLQALRGKLPVNVKFLVEGEEEVGDKTIAAFVRSNKDRLAADVVLVADTPMYKAGIPTIYTGLRGLLQTEWVVTIGGNDLHSGLYGGVAPNAIFGLVELLAKCKDASGRVLIDGFYEGVNDVKESEKSSPNLLRYDDDDFKQAYAKSIELVGEPGYSVYERVVGRPTLDVHGIRGGPVEEGPNTVIPATATAKVSARLALGQNPHAVFQSMKAFAKKHRPAGVSVKLRLLEAVRATLAPSTGRFFRIAAAASSEVWGAETVFTRSGGSIPVVGHFEDQLGISTILMGYGLPDDGLHAPNEKYNLRNFRKGIVTTAGFLELVGGNEADQGFRGGAPGMHVGCS